MIKTKKRFLEILSDTQPEPTEEKQKIFFEDFTPEELEALERLEAERNEDIQEEKKYYYYTI